MAGHKRPTADPNGMRPESLMMSYGYQPQLSEGALKCPIFQTSTFVFEKAEDGKAFFEVAYGLREKGPNESLGLIYSRLNNPDLEILEDRLALWDEAEGCAAFNSGMSATATALLELSRPGQVVLHSTPVYGGTDYLLKHILPRYGVHPMPFLAGESNGAMLARWQGEGAPPVAAILVETPANPTNALVDIAACAELSEKMRRGDERPPVLVDNTFLGPLWQQPLKHGADLVIYSATKFIGGHSDVIAGAVLGGRELMERIRTLRTIMGTCADPWTGWLLMRSLETLRLRMTCQMKNARQVANYLADHPKVARVYYLGHLESGSEQEAIFKRQCEAPGSVISFDVIGGREAAYRTLDALGLIKLAVSLGGTESLAEHPATMTHADVTPEEQRRYGISDSMVRLSVGIEHAQDLITDLEQALKQA